MKNILLVAIDSYHPYVNYTGNAGGGRKIEGRNAENSSIFRSTTQLKQLSGTLQSNLNTLQSGKPGFPTFTKDLNGCSWRAVAIFFIVLTIAMASTLAFVIGKQKANHLLLMM